MTETGTVHDYPKGLTFEKVWAMFQETGQKFQETDRLMKESQEEFDRRMKRLDKEIEKTNKIVGGLGNSIGGLVETLFAARLWEKFSAYPYGFKRAYGRLQIFDDVHSRELTEIDILLSDTEWVMAVEVKHEVKKTDVEYNLKRMSLIRKYPPAEARGKKLLGAMAGGTVSFEARKFAYESGFFVLELRGESVDLIPPPEGFAPKEW